MAYMYQHNIYRSILIIYGLIIDPHNDQFPVGLLAQLTEHCTALAGVRVRIKGVARGGPGVPVTPPLLQAFLNQTTYLQQVAMTIPWP